MFSFLEGKIEPQEPGRIVVNCGGVGYDVTIPLSSYHRIKEQATARVLVYLQVSDGVLKLYGFATEEERRVFLLLISVQGIGPSTAVRILSGVNAAELAELIRNANVGVLKKIKGIGPKTAERIVTELRDKTDRMRIAPAPGAVGAVPSEYRSAVQGLIALGYREAEAEKAVESAWKKMGETARAEDLVTEALRTGM